MHTRLQAKLLAQLFKIIPAKSQLWISTHSIGMIRTAVELQAKEPGSVLFLDFHDKNFDLPSVIIPQKANRDIWRRALNTALDDLSELISPRKIVICEGRPASLPGRNKEFDASCLRKIFSEEFPDVDFLSVGSEKDVTSEKIDVLTTLKSLNKGIQFIKLIDKDDRSPEEISELLLAGVKVLDRRDIENYLLDDEVLHALCKEIGKPEKGEICIQIKKEEIAKSVTRGNPQDDVKSASGTIYVRLKQELGLAGAGNTKEAFLRDTISPLVRPGMQVYQDLKRAIFL